MVQLKKKRLNLVFLFLTTANKQTVISSSFTNIMDLVCNSASVTIIGLNVDHGLVNEKPASFNGIIVVDGFLI